MFPPEFQESRFEDLDDTSDVDPAYEAQRLADYEVVRLRADNPGPLTLSGTNTWIVGARPAYVVDPGPALPDHIDRVLEAVDARGGLGGIALTHDHHDHGEAVHALCERLSAPVAAAHRWADVFLREGTSFGPLVAIPTPGHSADHFALATDRACFTGDAVLGEGSVFVDAYPGSLAGYMNGLARLATLDVDVLCPGHGPPIWEPEERIEQYLAHRYEREHRVLLALAAGHRSVAKLLDAAWPDVPAQLRPVAKITLAAHLDKLEEEGVLPAGVERPVL
ncbi:MAG TPA: MBL fold metallo-hydrolase [Solirubrobacteraceae bacterium]|jgi:glyoxylase-like metal-dependent hydrolase (beta-lactamase superfamily II)